MKKAVKLLSLLLIITIILAASALIFSGCNAVKRQAIIILPGIIGSAYIDTAAKDEEGNAIEKSVWDPFDGRIGWYDMFGEEGQSFVTDNKEMMAIMSETMVPLLMNLRKEGGLIDNMMINEDGLPTSPHVKVANMDTCSDLKYGTLGAYKEMYTELSNKYGKKYDVSVFQFDWRLDGQLAGEQLEQYIKEKKYKKVIFVGHSMGGMVASNYLARSQANRDKTKLFISIVTPFYGSVMAPQIVIDSSGLMKNLLPPMFASFVGGFDALLFPLVKNSAVGYQLFPSEQYFANPAYSEGESCVYINEQPASLQQLIDYVKAQEWAQHSKGGLKPSVLHMTDLYNSLYVDANGERVHVTDTVNTYFFVASGNETASVFRINSNGSTEIEKNFEGDGIVSSYSAARGLPLDSERVFLYENVSHTTLGIYFNLFIKNNVYNLIDAI